MRPSKGRILYAEDDADTRELVSYVVVHAGYEIFVAENSKDALLLAHTGSFDLYLIDNWMPGASGIDLCVQLRKFDNDTPILFFSGAAYEQDKRDALAAGAQAYLTKPAEIEELVREISLLISDARRSHTVANLVPVPRTGYLGL